VLVAHDGAQALQIADAHAGPLHLILTDLILPGINGRSAAEEIVSTRPEVKVLYISRYSDEAVARSGALSPGSAFLSKPFTTRELLVKVRDLLDGPSGLPPSAPRKPRT
jgi:CheY-like chemotaxis protein